MSLMGKWKFHEKSGSARRASVFLPVFAAFMVFGVAALWAGIGIMTRFGDIVLENMKPGVYNLRQLKNLPYVVTNPGQAKVEVLVDVVVPDKTQEGYEPIPDPSWVQVVPNQFVLEPGQNHFSDVVLTVPEDPKYQGRHFQATLWAHTVGTGFTAAGVNSRLRFSVGTVGPEALQREKKRKAMLTLDFDLKPETVRVRVPAGRAADLKALARASLKLTNRAEDPLKVRVISLPWQPQFSLPADYEPAPDPAWLTLGPETALVKGLTIGEFVPTVRIPAGPEHAGKNYAFLVKAEVVAEKSVPVEVYSRILVSVEGEGR